MTMDKESSETLADRRRVEDAYALVNAIWKTQGAGAALRYCHHLPHGRALPLGLDLAEIDRVLASIGSFYRAGFRDWPTQWFKAGDEYLDRGRTALANGYKETAAQMLFGASCCYHLAGYMHHDIGRLLPETEKSLLRAAEIYWEAAPYFCPPSHRVEILIWRGDPACFSASSTWYRKPPVCGHGRRGELQQNQHACRVGLLSCPRHCCARHGWAWAGRIPGTHRPALAHRGFRSRMQCGGGLAATRRASSTASASVSTGVPLAGCSRSMRSLKKKDSRR